MLSLHEYYYVWFIIASKGFPPTIITLENSWPPDPQGSQIYKQSETPLDWTPDGPYTMFGLEEVPV